MPAVVDSAALETSSCEEGAMVVGAGASLDVDEAVGASGAGLAGSASLTTGTVSGCELTAVSLNDTTSATFDSVFGGSCVVVADGVSDELESVCALCGCIVVAGSPLGAGGLLDTGGEVGSFEPDSRDTASSAAADVVGAGDVVVSDVSVLTTLSGSVSAFASS